MNLFKTTLLAIVSGALLCMAQENLLDIIQQAEIFINETYRTPIAKKQATATLKKISESETTDEDRIKRIKAAFPKAFLVKAENFIFQPPLSWKVHSLALGYDISESKEQTRTVTITETYLNSLKDESIKNEGENTRYQRNVKFSLPVPTTWNPFELLLKMPKAISETLKGCEYKQNSSEFSNSLWSQRQQKFFQRERKAIMQEIEKTSISKRHLSFTVTLKNSYNKKITCDLKNVSIPVYMGNRSCNKGARPYNLPLNDLVLQPGAQVDISFRMELDTTTARDLISWMEHDAPIIEIEKSGWNLSSEDIPNLIVKSSEEVPTATLDLVRPGSLIQWHIKLYDKNSNNVSLLDALNSVQETSKPIYGKQGIFTFDEKGNLSKVSGVPLGDEFAQKDREKRFMAFIQADGIFLSSNNTADLKKAITAGNCTIFVVDIREIDKLDLAIQEQIFKKLLKYVNGKNISHNKQNIDKLQLLVGNCYYFGWGVPANQNQALCWFEKSAEQGNVEAQLLLGDIYRLSDQEKAFKWFKKSADQKHSLGQCRLGVCYLFGIGTKKDHKKAFACFKESAKQGNADGQNMLGFCYRGGIGTKEDPQKAFDYFQKSAEQGNSEGLCNLGNCYRNGYGTNRDRKKAFDNFKKSANYESPRGQCCLGFCYLDKYGTKQSFLDAFEWFKKSADQGDEFGQYCLGYCYLNGIGTKADHQKAIFYFRKSAEQSIFKAQERLADCYDNGYGTKRNPEQARIWRTKSNESRKIKTEFDWLLQW